MATFKTISNSAAHSLTTRGVNTHASRNVSKMTVTNVHASNTTIFKVEIVDASGTSYEIARVKIPPQTTVVLSDNIGHDGSIYELKLQQAQNGSSAAELDIILK